MTLTPIRPMDPDWMPGGFDEDTQGMWWRGSDHRWYAYRIGRGVGGPFFTEFRAKEFVAP